MGCLIIFSREYQVVVHSMGSKVRILGFASLFAASLFCDLAQDLYGSMPLVTHQLTKDNNRAWHIVNVQ